MKNTLVKWQFAGFLFTAAAGTLLHFLFDWTQQNLLAALFSAVNESVWEHMKLLFFPMFLFAIVQEHLSGEQFPNFWNVKLRGILYGLILIPVLFYTYTGVFGVRIDWINICIFYLADAASYLLETRLLQKRKAVLLPSEASLLLLCLVALLFTILTFYPPSIPLFQDPATQLYGLS